MIGKNALGLVAWKPDIDDLRGYEYLLLQFLNTPLGYSDMLNKIWLFSPGARSVLRGPDIVGRILLTLRDLKRKKADIISFGYYLVFALPIQA